MSDAKTNKTTRPAKHRVERLAEGIELYLGDCRDVLPTLPKVDAVVTDPPYGVDFGYLSFDDAEKAVVELAEGWLPACRGLANVVAFSTGRLTQWIYPRPSWVLGWASRSGQGNTPWGFPCYWPILVYGKDPYLSRSLGSRPDTCFPMIIDMDKIDHPCPKPLNVWRWLIDRVSISGTILDVFMGSGTTGVACVQLERKFIGIELEPKYFDIACKRIDQELRKPSFFTNKPKRIARPAFFAGKKRAV